MNDRIMITGANGFVGKALAARLHSEGRNVLGIVRQGSSLTFPIEVVKSLADPLPAKATGINVVVHCAARTHVMKDDAADPLAEFRRINVDISEALARNAAAAGAKRFIFISSIKVNGEATASGKPFRADDLPAPQDAYGISKLEAEVRLREVAAETGMELVIIRPPLVYGPGVKGNFASMLRLVQKGLPLPLGAVYNQRSLVALDNLVDLIFTCLEHPSAAGEIFLAGDGEALSTSELLRRVGLAMGKSARLIPIPASLLRLGADLVGKKAVGDRLLGDLQVDIGKNHEKLGWTPPFTVDDGLKRCFDAPVV